MSIIGLLFFVIVAVLIFWLIGKAKLEPEPNKWALIIASAVLILWLLESIGVFAGLGLNTPTWRYR